MNLGRTGLTAQTRVRPGHSLKGLGWSPNSSPKEKSCAYTMSLASVQIHDVTSGQCGPVWTRAEHGGGEVQATTCFLGKKKQGSFTVTRGNPSVQSPVENPLTRMTGTRQFCDSPERVGLTGECPCSTTKCGFFKSKKKTERSQVWWYKPVTPAVRRLKDEGSAHMDCTAKPCQRETKEGQEEEEEE